MGKTSKCNSKEYETLTQIVKCTNVCMIKVFPDTKNKTGVNMLLRKRLAFKKVVTVHF